MTIRLGAESDPKGIKCLGESDSKRSQGDTHPYQASADAAQAITGNALSLYSVSQSKTRQSSDGQGTRLVVPSFKYWVHPLCWTHSVGGSGISTLANAFAMERYGSAASFPIR